MTPVSSANPPQYAEAAGILANAADIIESRGWTRGQGISPTGECCAIGAIQLASGVYFYNWSAKIITAANHSASATRRSRNAIQAFADRLPPAPQAHATAGFVVTHYNDICCPDSETMVQALRAAAGYTGLAVQLPTQKDTVNA